MNDFNIDLERKKFNSYLVESDQIMRQAARVIGNVANSSKKEGKFEYFADVTGEYCEVLLYKIVGEKKELIIKFFRKEGMVFFKSTKDLADKIGSNNKNSLLLSLRDMGFYREK